MPDSAVVLCGVPQQDASALAGHANAANTNTIAINFELLVILCLFIVDFDSHELCDLGHSPRGLIRSRSVLRRIA